MNTSRSASFLLGLALFGVACSAPADDQAAPAAGSSAPAEATSEKGADAGAAMIEVKNIAFKPSNMKVLKGTEVTWTSMDAGVRHTATSGTPGEREIAGVQKGSKAKLDGVFDGDLPDAGSEFSFTFKKAGTYEYFCEVHPSMTATIVVE